MTNVKATRHFNEEAIKKYEKHHEEEINMLNETERNHHNENVDVKANVTIKGFSLSIKIGELDFTDEYRDCGERSDVSNNNHKATSCSLENFEITMDADEVTMNAAIDAIMVAIKGAIKK